MTDRPPNPPERTFDLIELVRAMRAYTGLSQVGMAIKLGMSRNSYQRIETYASPVPVGLLDSVDLIVNEFDDAVEAVLSAARTQGGNVQVKVSDDPRREWERCVVGRAAIISRDSDVSGVVITPMIVGNQDDDMEGDDDADTHSTRAGGDVSQPGRRGATDRPAVGAQPVGHDAATA